MRLNRPEKYCVTIGETETVHPLGRPTDEVLLWENEPRFHEACKKHGMSVRMAAFQTTLPDPLPGEEYNVGLAADLLAGTVVGPGKVFSLNTAIGPYSRQRGFREGPTYIGTNVVKTVGGGVCKIATTLYNVATLAGMEIIERRPHGMLVPYVPPGQDATVSYGAQDFKFRNNTDKSILIWSDTRRNTLYMAFYGSSRPPEVSWHHQILRRQKTWTVYRYNPELPPGEEKVVLAGAEGMTVKTWLTIKYPDGKVVTRHLGIDCYKPMPRVVERGSVR